MKILGTGVWHDEDVACMVSSLYYQVSNVMKQNYEEITEQEDLSIDLKGQYAYSEVCFLQFHNHL